MKRVCISSFGLLIQFREITGIYSRSHTKHTNSLCRQNADIDMKWNKVSQNMINWQIVIETAQTLDPTKQGYI
jgi:hypothetical protein